ncbi:MurR/RpiR family transcriptional regulator [Enterococcus nangangensis]|uniref:MurR/RpiR family transcriptional regulator n=1 Tax=Enterococcus nangangensis TaxID=2559926 RepID=UPI0010F7B3F6|nr:MurR/RpiR family transcriptional regulator [Enterococcus nangangensis]
MALFGKLDFNQLSATDRALYQYIASHEKEVAYMRVRELASASHTSASSVMRFVKKLGYPSFAAFKGALQAPSTTSTPDYLQKGPQLLAPEKFPQDLPRHLHIVAEAIYEAENVIFFGMGASGSVCEYAARKMATIGYNSFALTDPTYPIAQKLRNTSQNVLIVLSVTGKTTELVETVNNFKNHEDFVTVAITANADSLLAEMCQHTLSYQVEIVHQDRFNDLTSQIPALFVVEALVAEIQKLEK